MKYLALLRGINVSGQKKIPMAELRTVLTNLGLYMVQTYIQTGNVIFEATAKPDLLRRQIEGAIWDHFGFKVPTLVVTPKQLEQIFKACPFAELKKQNSYFLMLYTPPDQALVNEVASITYTNEDVVVTNNCVYFYSTLGYGKTKYNNNFFERKLKITATARNYKTMVKLLSLLAD